MKKIQRNLKSLVLTIVPAVFLGCALAPEGPYAARESNDAIITSSIKQKIFSGRTLRTSRIYVNTTQGLVRLTGFVEKAPYVETAEKIARETAGVVAVKEQLFVKN